MQIKAKQNEWSELDRFFDLYQQFWPNKKISKNMRLAWGMALEPFPYEDVKAAAVAHARKNKFPPDVSDLTAGLMPEQAEPGTDDWRWLDAYLDDTYVSNPVTRYAAAHGGTVGEAEMALGITWEEAQEGRRKP